MSNVQHQFLRTVLSFYIVFKNKFPYFQKNRTRSERRNQSTKMSFSRVPKSPILFKQGPLGPEKISAPWKKVILVLQLWRSDPAQTISDIISGNGRERFIIELNISPPLFLQLPHLIPPDCEISQLPLTRNQNSKKPTVY